MTVRQAASTTAKQGMIDNFDFGILANAFPPNEAIQSACLCADTLQPSANQDCQLFPPESLSHHDLDFFLFAHSSPSPFLDSPASFINTFSLSSSLYSDNTPPTLDPRTDTGVLWRSTKSNGDIYYAPRDDPILPDGTLNTAIPLRLGFAPAPSPVASPQTQKTLPNIQCPPSPPPQNIHYPSPSPNISMRRGPGRPPKPSPQVRKDKDSTRTKVIHQRLNHNESANRSRARFTNALEELWKQIPNSDRLLLGLTDLHKPISRAENVHGAILYIRHLQKKLHDNERHG